MSVCLGTDRQEAFGEERHTRYISIFFFFFANTMMGQPYEEPTFLFVQNLRDNFHYTRNISRFFVKFVIILCNNTFKSNSNTFQFSSCNTCSKTFFEWQDIMHFKKAVSDRKNMFRIKLFLWISSSTYIIYLKKC